MISETALKLTKCFSCSFINSRGEFIAHQVANTFFNLSNCSDELEVKCKLLEWFSRPICKGEPFRTKKKNNEFREFLLNGINEFLETDLNFDEIEIIYTDLGNSVNRELTIEFIESGYDMDILKDAGC